MADRIRDGTDRLYVGVVIKGGKIEDVNILRPPDHPPPRILDDIRTSGK